MPIPFAPRTFVKRLIAMGWRAVIFCLIGTAAVVPQVTPAYGEGPHKAFTSDQVKAVFLIQFCRFSTWPDRMFLGPDAPIVIGVWGDDSFARLVTEAAAGEKISGRPIEVRRIHSGAETQGLHLVYVSPDAETRFHQWPHEDARGTLFVGDSPAVFSSGGHIQFIRGDNRLRFRIDLVALKRSQVSMSSSLLRIAEIVSP